MKSNFFGENSMEGYSCLTNEQMLAIIGQVDFCYLGFVDCTQPYIYPMYFAAEQESGSLVFYVRSLSDSLLVNCSKRNDDVCLLFSYGSDGVVSTVLALCDAEKCEKSCDDHGSTLFKCKVCSMSGRAYQIVQPTTA